jgi:hypothetical protein
VEVEGVPETLCVGESAPLTLRLVDGSGNPVSGRIEVSTGRITVENAIGETLDAFPVPEEGIRVWIRCTSEGRTGAMFTASDIEGLHTTDVERDIGLTCVPCDDAGVDAGPDAGAPMTGTPATTFVGPPLPDPTGDHFDSAGGDPAYTGPDIDLVQMGSEREAQSQADADTDFNMSTYECGEATAARVTVCPTDVQPMPEGELFTFVMELAESVPTASTTASYVYSLAVDSDGDPANDFVPLPEFPLDYFRGTDRWYELRWDHLAGSWSVTVTQLDAAGARSQVPSTVRAVIEGARVTFFVAASELPATVPTYRLSAYRDDGMGTPSERGADTSLGRPTLALLPAGCGFTGVECRNAELDRGRVGALESCGADHTCRLEIMPGRFLGVCAPPGTASAAELDCLCATPTGRSVIADCP